MSLNTRSQTDYEYVGAELELFANATNWKSYFASMLKPFMGTEVLEVGAGIGETTRILCTGSEKHWVCLEPDAKLAIQLERNLLTQRVPPCVQLVVGTINDIEDTQFDTILYIDVLEHLTEDGDELHRAAGRLSPGGHLIVLSPAHPWLYSKFDQSIGHVRRYTKRSLAALTPANTSMIRNFYLDSAGMLASLGNRLLLRQALPSPRQIAFWDRGIVPVSKLLDRFTCYGLGKSVVGVWQRDRSDTVSLSRSTPQK